jgi:hypothetical protein
MSGMDDQKVFNLLDATASIDGLCCCVQVLTIGATNLAQELDQALLRPGRFEVGFWCFEQLTKLHVTFICQNVASAVWRPPCINVQITPLLTMFRSSMCSRHSSTTLLPLLPVAARLAPAASALQLARSQSLRSDTQEDCEASAAAQSACSGAQCRLPQGYVSLFSIPLLQAASFSLSQVVYEIPSPGPTARLRGVDSEPRKERELRPQQASTGPIFSMC